MQFYEETQSSWITYLTRSASHESTTQTYERYPERSEGKKNADTIKTQNTNILIITHQNIGKLATC